MKKTVISILFVLALALAVLVPPAFAAQWGTTLADRSQISTSSPGGAYDFKEMKGKEVKDNQGNLVGAVNDIVRDANGHVFVVISDRDTGKNIAVPSEAFSSIGQGNTVDLNLSQNQLANAPEFDQASLSDSNWTQNLHRHYGIQPSF